MTDFAQELKAWRAREGLTQEQAAAFLGVPHRTYQNWEQGRDKPSQAEPLLKIFEMMAARPQKVHP